MPGFMMTLWSMIGGHLSVPKIIGENPNSGTSKDIEIGLKAEMTIRLK